MTNKKEKKENQPVLVTTEFRGVFFGYLKSDEKSPNEITLTGAKNCIYWSTSVGGFLGLASTGPDGNCRIGKRVEKLTLYKITSITPVTKNATDKWEAA
jgi:hypothetical protein